MYKISSKRTGGAYPFPSVGKEGKYVCAGEEFDNFGPLEKIRETEKAYLFHFYFKDNSFKSYWVPKSVCFMRGKDVFIQRWWYLNEGNTDKFEKASKFMAKNVGKTIVRRRKGNR